MVIFYLVGGIDWFAKLVLYLELRVYWSAWPWIWIAIESKVGPDRNMCS
jgi:hypothetical protein